MKEVSKEVPATRTHLPETPTDGSMCSLLPFPLSRTLGRSQELVSPKSTYAAYELAASWHVLYAWSHDAKGGYASLQKAT